jgi:hypothetical protein
MKSEEALRRLEAIRLDLLNAVRNAERRELHSTKSSSDSIEMTELFEVFELFDVFEQHIRHYAKEHPMNFIGIAALLGAALVVNHSWQENKPMKLNSAYARALYKILIKTLTKPSNKNENTP